MNEKATKKSGRINSANFTIMVIDDYLAIRRNIKLFLERYNCNVIEAPNGKIALEILTGNSCENIDAIIVDLMMPAMNGAEFIIKAKEMFAEKLPPLFVCSCKSDLELVKKVVKLGIKGYMIKPVDFRELKKRLNLAVPGLAKTS